MISFVHLYQACSLQSFEVEPAGNSTKIMLSLQNSYVNVSRLSFIYSIYLLVLTKVTLNHLHSQLNRLVACKAPFIEYVVRIIEVLLS